MANKSREELVGLGVTMEENFSEWYNELVQKAGLAEYAPIGGCMIIKPFAYSIWENIVRWFDTRIKETGVQNAYFPLFIPESFFQREAEHFEGFTPEVAWIEKRDDSEERFALRPTSETIIYDAYSKWIRSWRDLPLRMNQWCNIVRWECKATRLFLRTREFLWQEGHTVHASEKEAADEAKLRAEQYRELMETQLAVPVLMGKKSRSETFAGALYTLTLEAFMPDGKALQMGTSHHLGQHFAKVFKIKYRDKDKEEKYAWQTSWGISTRLIGSVVMTHGDDKGLILPPRIAPVQVIIVPIYKTENMKTVLAEANKVKKELSDFSVEVDERDECSPGWKFNEWEMKGVPLRIEIGPRDIENKQVMGVRRDTGEKMPIRRKLMVNKVRSLMEEIQLNLFEKAKERLQSSMVTAKDYEELKKHIKEKKFVKAHWCGEESCEEAIKENTSATVRLIESDDKRGKCVHCKHPSKHLVYFAKAY
ncbi:MAG: proline--tRNA ligase [Candidatus Aenigmarchaeota archaeon]|nr:proline--tRNA ligase [Candidatus Aenigmarchaeota archaeon]